MFVYHVDEAKISMSAKEYLDCLMTQGSTQLEGYEGHPAN